MNVGIKKLTPDAIIPAYQSGGAACFDIHRTSIDSQSPGTAVFNTGLVFEVPVNHVMLLFSRSGQSFANDVRLANCVGVIDSDFRGELKVKLRRDSDKTYWTEPGDRIAQAMILPVERATFIEKTELSDTVRGTGGYGSTGVK